MNRRNFLHAAALSVVTLPAALRAANAIAPLKKPNQEWQKLLPEANYEVLFLEGTERPFSSPLNAEHRPGTFICFACNLPLFDSTMKFDSGTGWPSFFTSMPGSVAMRVDRAFGMTRDEYHCARCGGHQGHVFDDGPKPTGKRYCNNGVSLSFIPKGEKLPPLRT